MESFSLSAYLRFVAPGGLWMSNLPKVMPSSPYHRVVGLYTDYESTQNTVHLLLARLEGMPRSSNTPM